MRRFPIACLLCLTVGWVSNPARAETRMGVIATKTASAQDLASLLEIRLAQRPSTALVERNEIDKVLGEQELQALLVADAPGKRAALGKMLKADLLIFLAESQRPKPHVMVVVCETARGLRLCAEPVFLTSRADTDVASVLKKVEDAVKKGQEKITDIVAVPPLLNNSLTQEADNLQGGFACLVEQALLRRPGLLVVELAEAKALAREVAVSGSPGIERRLPLYLLGEYRVEGTGGNRRGQFAWRLLRGEQELGRREEKGLAWTKFPPRLRQAATELIDKVAGKRVLPSDPLAEAKQLADREHAFVEIGQWQQALALAEASLLLNPDQPAVHGDALHAILEINGDEFQWGISPKAFPWLRAALPHLEAYFCGTKVPFADRTYVETRRWGNDLRIGGELRFPPEVRKDYYALLCAMSDTADRILVAKAAAKVSDESLEFLSRWDEKFGLFDDGTGKPAWRSTWLPKELPAICEHRLKLLQAFSWMGGKRNYYCHPYTFFGYDPSYYGLATLPGLRGFLADTPMIELTDLTQPELYPLYLDFFAKVKKMPDPHLQELADRFMDRFHRLPELRKAGEKKTKARNEFYAKEMRKAQHPPVQKPVHVKDPEVVFHKLTLRQTTADGNDEIVERPEIDKWMPIYKGCDLVDLQYNEVALMKEKGRLRVLPIEISRSSPTMKSGVTYGGHMSTFSNVCWDGQYIWALNPGDDGRLAVIEPRREKIWRAGPKSGLPPSVSCAIAPLGHGKVCIAGYFGRLWIAMASFDPGKGFKVDVFHEARDVLDLLHMGLGVTPGNTSPKLALPVLFAATVTAPAVDGHPAQRRVFIGRVANSPLLVDPETKAVTAADYYMSDYFRLKDENTIYWSDNSGRWGPEGFFGPLYRISVPGFTREVLSPDCAYGKRTLFQGRFYMTADNPAELGGKDAFYVADDPKGPFHALRGDVPGRAARFFLSNHYGLLLSVYSGVYQVELAGTPAGTPKADDEPAARDTADGKNPKAQEKDEQTRKAEDEASARKKKAEEAQAARAPKFRQWSDASGKFHRTAKFRGLANKVVKLELEDGSVINVPLEKLGDEDQKYIRQRTH